MNEKKLTKKEKDFCHYYIRLRNHKEAAQKSGYTFLPEYAGMCLLAKKQIREKINELEKEARADQPLVSSGLQRLAFGSISDAVKLILSAGDNTSPDPDTLDLFNVAEIKYTCGKSMEIKFFDRLKALESLSHMTEDENKNSAHSFYEALERSAVRNSKGDECG